MSALTLLSPLVRPLAPCSHCVQACTATAGDLRRATEVAARSLPFQAAAQIRWARFDLGAGDSTPSEPSTSRAAAPPTTAYDPEPEPASPQAGQRPRSAPFVPPSVDKLINIMMQHGQKDTARRIVFDTSHALYNMTRRPNPRPELKQRNPRFAKH